MGKEIERKFLILNEDFKKLSTPKLYQQGFLNTDKERVVRVRTVENKGFLTIKGITENATRTEFEYEIPVEEAREMLLDLCIKPLITKFRYTIPIDDVIWEVDVFEGENKGLVIAEIELRNVKQSFNRPSWIGNEVTDDPRYYNSNLALFPYNCW